VEGRIPPVIPAKAGIQLSFFVMPGRVPGIHAFLFE
jgi:hypothetical protein